MAKIIFFGHFLLRLSRNDHSRVISKAHFSWVHIELTLFYTYFLMKIQDSQILSMRPPVSTGIYTRVYGFSLENRCKKRSILCTQQKCALEMTREWSFLLSLSKKWPKKIIFEPFDRENLAGQPTILVT